MKHILNNLSDEEKNSIREQHSGGMKVMTENFSRLIKSKLGDSKPLVETQEMPEGIFKRPLSKLDVLKRDLDDIFSQKVAATTTTGVSGEWKHNEVDKSYEQLFDEMEELIARYKNKESDDSENSEDFK